MAFAVRGLLGLALMAASAAVLGWALVELIDTGSCASDGGYGLPPCPPGTEWRIIALFPAISAFLLGGWLFAGRGRRATAPGLPA